jgi:hypothetical protein
MRKVLETYLMDTEEDHRGGKEEEKGRRSRRRQGLI